jgi:hypothetical protein
MDVSGQIHASAALSSGNALPLPTEHKAERTHSRSEGLRNFLRLFIL